MGNILDGLNPVNKIGTVPTNFNSTLNTISTQGFKLNTGNLLSNITNTKGFTPQAGSKFSSIIPNVETVSQAKEAPVRTLVEASGYEVTTLSGKTAWVPNGTPYNEVAKLVGAPTNNEAIGAIVDGVLNTLDFLVLKGTGKGLVMAGIVIATAGTGERATLLIRGQGSAFNYSYGQGYDLPSSLLMALGTQANFANFKLFKDAKFVKNSEILTIAANTSKDYYKFLHKSEFFGDKNPFAGGKFLRRANYFSGDNLLLKNAKGAKLEETAFKVGFLPFNPGLYILNKTWATPTAFFKGKVGITQNEYEVKYEEAKEQQEVILTALDELDSQTSSGPDTHGSVENYYEKSVLSNLGKIQNQQKAEDFGGASRRFSSTSNNIQKEGLTLLGNVAAYSRAVATFAYEQIDEFQTYKQQRNNYQKMLIGGASTLSDYTFALGEAQKTIKLNVGLSVANVALGATKLAINAAEVVSAIPVTIANWTFLQYQVQANNLKVGLEKLSNWWNDVPDKAETVTAPAGSTITTKKKSPPANVTNTMINMPAFIPPTKMTDNLRVAGPVSNNPVILDRYKTPEQIAIREASVFVKNVRADVSKKIEELTEKHESHWYSLSTPPWTEKEKKELQQLTQEYAQLSKILKGVADSVKKGRVKYNPVTKKITKVW
jgi:hypothetical protein